MDSNPEHHTAHVVVSVTVEDVNDNAPMFVKQPFQTIVSTDAEHGEIIKKVSGEMPACSCQLAVSLPPFVCGGLVVLTVGRCVCVDVGVLVCSGGKSDTCV